MSFSPNSGLIVQHYQNINAQTVSDATSPHRLVQILMQGALEKIALARIYMQRGEIELKSTHVSWAISIIDGLRMSLDQKQGRQIAENLSDLYDYMSRRLATANQENSEKMLDEVIGLLQEIKSAWDAVPELLQIQESRQETMV